MNTKTIGSLIVATALCANIGSINSEASTFQNQWSNIKINQQQNVVTNSPASILEKQKVWDTSNQMQLGLSAGAAQGQSLNLTTYQFQNVKTTGAATVTQKVDTEIHVSDQQSVDHTEQQQSTLINDSKEQETVVAKSATIRQSQRSTDAIIQVQATIKNGPSIQHQFVNHHSYKSQSVVENPFLNY